MNRNERIRKLSRASDWRAALTILTSTFAKDGRVWQHVDLERERIHFEEILADGTFSSGERMLLTVAASLFNQDHRINLWEVLNRVDDTNAALILTAIRSFCFKDEP